MVEEQVRQLSLDLYRQEMVGKPCRRVKKSDDLMPLIEEMVRFCRSHGGTGLAAPQIGEYLQLAIAFTTPANIDLTPGVPLIRATGVTEVLINPEIVNLGGRDLLETEGCLSLPPADQATARVWRSEIAHVRSGTLEDPDANMVTVYKGGPARIVQHEIDHLNGVFFIDHCGPVGRNIVLRRFGKYLRNQRIEKEKE